jgi:hypothetical protein
MIRDELPRSERRVIGVVHFPFGPRGSIVSEQIAAIIAHFRTGKLQRWCR